MAFLLVSERVYSTLTSALQSQERNYFVPGSRNCQRSTKRKIDERHYDTAKRHIWRYFYGIRYTNFLGI
jgi:hypothetical protein